MGRLCDGAARRLGKHMVVPLHAASHSSVHVCDGPFIPVLPRRLLHGALDVLLVGSGGNGSTSCGSDLDSREGVENGQRTSGIDGGLGRSCPAEVRGAAERATTGRVVLQWMVARLPKVGQGSCWRARKHWFNVTRRRTWSCRSTFRHTSESRRGARLHGGHAGLDRPVDRLLDERGSGPHGATGEGRTLGSRGDSGRCCGVHCAVDVGGIRAGRRGRRWVSVQRLPRYRGA